MARAIALLFLLLAPVALADAPRATMTLAFHVNQPGDPPAIKETLVAFAKREGLLFFSAASSEPPPPPGRFLFMLQSEAFKAAISNLKRSDRAVVTITGAGDYFATRAQRLRDALKSKWPDLAPLVSAN